MFVGVDIQPLAIEQLVIRFLRDEKIPAIRGRGKIDAAILKNELTHLVTSNFSKTEQLKRTEIRVLWRQFQNSYAIAAAHIRDFNRLVDTNDHVNSLLEALMADSGFMSESISSMMEEDDGTKYQKVIDSLSEIDLEVLEAFATTTQPKKIIKQTEAKTSTVYLAITRLKKAFADEYGEEPTYDRLQKIAKSIFEEPE